MKDIPGYEGRYRITQNGEVYSIRSRRYLSPSFNKHGYLQINISDSNHKIKCYRIHRLVASTYLDQNVELTEVNHKDGVKTNNHVSNLEWSNRSLNILHAYSLGGGKKPIAYKLECRQGHELNDKNLYPGAEGKRSRCIKCHISKSDEVKARIATVT